MTTWQRLEEYIQGGGWVGLGSGSDGGYECALYPPASPSIRSEGITMEYAVSSALDAAGAPK